MTDDVYGVLSLAVRARKVLYGMAKCESAIRFGKAYLVIVAADSSDNTGKKLHDMCEYRDIPMFRTFTKDKLGKLFSRDEISVVVITDESFSRLLLEKLERS